jgi:hypothetical protein
MMRLLEVLLHTGSQLAGWRTAKIHAAVLAAFDLTPTITRSPRFGMISAS